MSSTSPLRWLFVPVARVLRRWSDSILDDPPAPPPAALPPELAGAPQHWLDLARRHAPHLLEPGGMMEMSLPPPRAAEAQPDGDDDGGGLDLPQPAQLAAAARPEAETQAPEPIAAPPPREGSRPPERRARPAPARRPERDRALGELARPPEGARALVEPARPVPLPEDGPDQNRSPAAEERAARSEPAVIPLPLPLPSPERAPRARTRSPLLGPPRGMPPAEARWAAAAPRREPALPAEATAPPGGPRAPDRSPRVATPASAPAPSPSGPYFPVEIPRLRAGLERPVPSPSRSPRGRAEPLAWQAPLQAPRVEVVSLVAGEAPAHVPTHVDDRWPALQRQGAAEAAAGPDGRGERADRADADRWPSLPELDLDGGPVAQDLERLIGRLRREERERGEP
jgi:hypothetical protein